MAVGTNSQVFRLQAAGSRERAKPLTVGEVVSRIRAAVEGEFPTEMWVEGELSNVSYATSGHLYFHLVDEKVTDRRGQRVLLPCAFFFPLNQNLKFKLKDGLKVVCLGQISTYEAKGQYQVRVQRVLPQGKGELQLAFEQLKKQLEVEGLFAEARKRPIPSLPERVGVVTSIAGSAIHDIVSKLRGTVHVIILPVKVQGEGAAVEIAQAVDTANRLHLADVLIVGRGGGSIEDLWAFNEEPVARALARSRIPVISAVGHQDDWTIADYVADHRASTPTDAAKLLIAQQETFRDQARELLHTLLDSMQLTLDDQTRRVTELAAQMRLLHPVNQLDRYLHRTQALQSLLTQSTRFTLAQEERHLQGLSGRLHALSPLAVLARGYSITFKLPEAHIVTAARRVHPGDRLQTRLAVGHIYSTVTHIRADDDAS